MKAYLSGAMEYVPDEGKSWRTEIELWLKRELGHMVFNPVTETEKLVGNQNAQDYRVWKNTDIERYRTFVRQFVDHDIQAVQNDCDYLICYWDQAAARGGGTQGEVTMAYHSGKQVYMVCELPAEEISGWILACATELFDSFDELKQFLVQQYGGREA
ncbi:MAG: hypothetical protein HQ562_01390 [Candidatus Marinimicrobia bacterium]|nr:hypothetical protein [Candidatus Neomarinimicrobiota bacterium]